MSSSDYLPRHFRMLPWKEHGVPILLYWAGNQVYPWSVSDERLLQILSNICSSLYHGDAGLSTPKASNAAIKLARRNIASWCDAFGGAAAIAINHIFMTSRECRRPGSQKDSIRSDFACYNLDGHRFLFQCSSGADPSKYRGLFRGQLVGTTFARHFASITHTLTVIGLDEGAWKSEPRAALALSAAAVEHVLMLWASGRLNAEMNLESQTSLVTDGWNKAWRKSTVPFLGLVACLDERDMMCACTLAHSMMEQLAEITPSHLGNVKVSRRMQKNKPLGVMILD